MYFVRGTCRAPDCRYSHAPLTDEQRVQVLRAAEERVEQDQAPYTEPTVTEQKPIPKISYDTVSYAPDPL